MQTKNLKKKQNRASFAPKKSKRVYRSLKRIQKDGDTWIEHVLVDTQKKSMRSYFESKNTDRLVWDEPPSGGDSVTLAPIDVIISIKKSLI